MRDEIVRCPYCVLDDHFRPNAREAGGLVPPSEMWTFGKSVPLSEVHGDETLADNIPNFDTFTPSSRIHQEWIGKLHALIEQWKPSEEFSLGMQISWIGIDATRASSVSKIISTLHRAIADLEHRLPPGPDRVFGPGAVYDFFKALRDLLLSAEKSVLIVDPYMDEQGV